LVTGFDYLSQDKALQEHWLKRFVAILVDFVIVYLPLMFFFDMAGVQYLLVGGASGIVLFAYAVVFDLGAGGTPGKLFLHVRAVPLVGRMSLGQAMMRNLSKVFPVLLLLDWVVGMAVDTHDPRQKWTDQVAKTSVIALDRPKKA
jgi:uncharacterized RDD family membrane protein YckC